MSFFGELKRRNVVRVGAAYVASSWLLIQVAETTFPAFGLGETAIRTVIIIAGIGLVPALVLAWAFELTPAGLKRDTGSERDPQGDRRVARRLDRVVMIVLALALGYFAFDHFVIAPQREASLAAAAREAGRTESILDTFGEQSIAVLPFTDLSPGRDQAYFADGLTEEILNVLARIDGLRVVSRSSAFALRDQKLSVPEIGRRLDVGHVLEGSVRRSGGRLRLTAQLIEARTDTHLWSQTYDRAFDDVFAIQDQVAAQVAQELKVRMLAPPRASGVIDAASYELYLEGLGLLAKGGFDRLTQAIEVFERITTSNPSFAPAFASLAIGQFRRGPPAEDLYQRIEANARRALALDPDNSDALAVLGRALFLEGRTSEGRELLERSIAVHPNGSLGYRWLGLTYQSSDPARYVALTQKAALVDPLEPSIHLLVSNAFATIGQTPQALAAARSRLAYDPDDPFANVLAANAHFLAGHLGRSLKSYYREFRERPDDGQYDWIQHVLINLGEIDLAAAWGEEIEQRTGAVDHAGTIVLHLRGETERALQLAAANMAHTEVESLHLAFVTLRMTGDSDRARSLYQQGFARLGQNPEQFNPDLLWVYYIDYALILQRGGEVAAAGSLLDDMKVYFDRQAADGIVVAGNQDHLQYLYAELHGIRGDAAATATALERASREGFTCVLCVRSFPHFDYVRDDPAFAAVFAELLARTSSQRERLSSEGMLLTPEQVLALDHFEFDPFVE